MGRISGFSLFFLFFEGMVWGDGGYVMLVIVFDGFGYCCYFEC